MLGKAAFVVDSFLLAFALGATLWFFFVQSPALFKAMGKEKFIPIQMRLTKLLFRTLAVLITLMLGATIASGGPDVATHVATAGLATFAVWMNHFIVVPRALKAGGKMLGELRAQRERGEQSGGSVADFASEGGGGTSKVWHRLVVLHVLAMVVGLVSHGATIMPG